MSLRSWSYSGVNAERANADGWRQRSCAGDVVYDDELGKGILDTLDGSELLIEFGRSGEPKEIKRRPAHAVFAETCRKTRVSSYVFLEKPARRPPLAKFLRFCL